MSEIQMLYGTDDITKVDIFLGGTCSYDENCWDWRRTVIAHIPDTLSYYDPFIRAWEYPDLDWNDSFMEKEDIAKKCCTIAIYVLTPDMTGVYTIAEITAHLLSTDFKAKKEGVAICIEDDPLTLKAFPDTMKKSLAACARLWKSYGAQVISFKELLAQLDSLK